MFHTEISKFSIEPCWVWGMAGGVALASRDIRQASWDCPTAHRPSGKYAAHCHYYSYRVGLAVRAEIAVADLVQMQQTGLVLALEGGEQVGWGSMYALRLSMRVRHARGDSRTAHRSWP